MSESLIKKHLQKPIPDKSNKKNNNILVKEATPATPSKPTPSPVEKESQKQDSQKDDSKQLPSVEKENDASSESGKDKTPATKPAKGEVESSSTTPTKEIHNTDSKCCTNNCFIKNNERCCSNLSRF